MAPRMAGLSKEEIQEFESTYHYIVDDLISDQVVKDISHISNWMKRVLNYNVPHGKKVRGLMIPMTLKAILRTPSKEDMKSAFVLGWCMEILQASCLVADDIMDGSETRRGRPCWYKVDGMGAVAFNDSLLLEHIVYHLLRKYFKHKSYYTSLVELFLDSTYKTVIGQSLDTRAGLDKNYEDYTMKLFATIVKYKTSYYTILLPLMLAMTMTHFEDQGLHEKVEKLAFEIGHFFQVQDDYLDCFGDVSVTGKMGTDIQDGKCSWLFVTSKNLCSPEQWAMLKNNYGNEDDYKVAFVKKLYVDLDLQNEYFRYEEEFYKRVHAQIKEVGNEMPEGIFFNLLEMLYKRLK